MKNYTFGKVPFFLFNKIKKKRYLTQNFAVQFDEIIMLEISIL